jgi:hypothetical protein
MITESQLPELEILRKIENRLPIQIDRDSCKLVVQGDNDSLPVHRWFRFKESFSADLLAEVLKGLSIGKEFRLLDPFCGVGTTLVASQEMAAYGFRIESVGIERNPFIGFAAQAKVNWPGIDSNELFRLGDNVLATDKGYSCVQIPPLSSLTTGRCISRYLSKRLLRIRELIKLGGPSVTNNAALLGLASAIEIVSNIRKDGRALRLVKRERQRLHAVLRSKWHTIAEDAAFLQKTVEKPLVPVVMEGDGRRPSQLGVGPGSIDLILTSPPYPNNIDYSEVYKLELWLLGFVQDNADFLELRRKTFRSHPTCSDIDELRDFMAELRADGVLKIIKPILKRMENNGEPWRRKVLLGYFHDMWISLSEQYKCLKRGGCSILVVGNSLHGGSHLPYVIPTDIVVALLAESLGFQVEQIRIARSLKRRLAGNHFLRESMVVLRK